MYKRQGLYDVETINAVRAALDTLPGGRDILMYGEPWQGGGSQLHRYEANKANLAMLNERIGIFCDDTRDTIKGGCFNAREPGYVEGRPCLLYTSYSDIDTLRSLGYDIQLRRGRGGGYWLASRTFELSELKLLVEMCIRDRS